MTVKEQQEWKIPPCISNWKNAKVLLQQLSQNGRVTFKPIEYI
jgi:hypothetical protein